MRAESRLRRLERAAGRFARKRRCALCQHWPATLIQRINDPFEQASPPPAALASPPGASSPAAPPSGAPSPAELPPSVSSPATPLAGSTSDAEPQPGQRCPGCGWQPTLVVVEYVDDWRRFRQESRHA